jgi:Dolichyl-phosphate-mannose-protein mannosyltransferase
MRRARSRRVVGAVLVALVVAGGALRLAASSDPGHRLFPDEQSYGRLATGLAERGDYGDPRLGDRTRWAPGAPVAFAAAERLLPAGRAGQPHEVPAARTAQALLGTLMIPAAFALAALLAGPGAGLAAAAAIALFPPLITVSRYQISEPLAALLVLLGMLALAKGCARGAARAGWAAAAGALLGLAVLTRADLLVPVLLAGPALWLATRRTAGVRPAAALTAAVLAVILPWVAFASVNRGRLVPVSGGGPGTLFMGTYLPGEGTVVGFKRGLAGEARAHAPDLRGVDPLRMPAGRVLDAVAARRPAEPRDAALTAEALANVRRYALGDPPGYAAMTLRKVERLWSRPFQTPQPGLIAIHLALLAAGLAGLVLGVLRREPVAVVLGAIVALSTLDNMVLVPEPRHNMPLFAALVAVGVAGLAAAPRAERRKPGASAQDGLSRSHAT